jgi:cold shock CspA family protein
MGRSQETFNKKEKEKKKQKKRQDKQQKMEERKSNPDKAKSFEDMIAYVDENGNITSTPPDPRMKSVVKLEDIEVSVSRQVPMEPEDLIRKGTVTFFNDSKGYGFIRDHETQESVFFHVNGLIDPVGETDKVTFEMEKGPKGMNAVRVKLQA